MGHIRIESIPLHEITALDIKARVIDALKQVIDLLSTHTDDDDIPDDTALAWDEWNAKVNRLLRECGEEA